MAGVGDSLPPRFPIFPLRGCLLLPGGNLPLNIFEQRYLAMIRDAMQTDRVIGMIQPEHDADQAAAPSLFRTGCAGRISNFSQTEDGRFLITLTGLCRFDIAQELEVATPYRQVEADYTRWRQDLQPAEPPLSLKVDLLAVLRPYFARHGIEADWPTLQEAPLAALITSLAMISPFAANEKQAMIEARDITRQGELLVALMQMEAMPMAGSDPTVKH
jgi:Lon protease-like protein